MPFEIVRNDITKMRVDAIVNAANSTLLGGGGVDGAIHRAAGPELLAECRTLGGCRTGQAKITRGYRLPCKYVIHTVGPVWQGGNSGEEAALVSCYRESMRLALEHGCETVAFPLISSGAFGYPKDQALKVATDTIRDFLLDHDLLVCRVIFDRRSFTISQRLYTHIQAFIQDAYIGPDYEAEEKARRSLNIMHRTESHPQAWDMECEESAEPLELSGPIKTTSSGSPFRRTDADEYAAPNSLKEYLDQMDEGFRDMLLRKIDERHLTDAECYKRANIDRKLFNKIKNQANYRPGKSTVLALAVSLRLPLDETKEMLMKAGFSLSHSSKFDLIVEYFIAHGNYDIYEINEALFSFDQKLLGSLA